MQKYDVMWCQVDQQMADQPHYDEIKVQEAAGAEPDTLAEIGYREPRLILVDVPRPEPTPTRPKSRLNRRQARVQDDGSARKPFPSGQADMANFTGLADEHARARAAEAGASLAELAIINPPDNDRPQAA